MLHRVKVIFICQSTLNKFDIGLYTCKAKIVDNEFFFDFAAMVFEI